MKTCLLLDFFLIYFSYIPIRSPSMPPVKRRLLLLLELLELRLLHLFGMVDKSSESRWKHTAASDKYDPPRMVEVRSDGHILPDTVQVSFFPNHVCLFIPSFQASSQQKLSKNLQNICPSTVQGSTSRPPKLPAKPLHPASLLCCEHVSNRYQLLPENLSLNFTGYPLPSALSKW